MLTDDLLEKAHELGIYYLFTDVSDESVSPISQSLLLHAAENRTAPVTIYINTDGGCSASAWGLVDIMSMVQFQVNTVVLGNALSAGATIAMAGDYRQMTTNSVMMTHHFSWGGDPRYPALVARRKAEDDEAQRMVQHYIQHSRYTSPQEISQNLLRAEDYYMTAAEALNHGLVDKILRPLPKNPKDVLV